MCAGRLRALLAQVNWDQSRYDDICGQLRPFLVQSGFSSAKTSFVPVGAMQGVNLIDRDQDAAEPLRAWYSGPTLVDLLGQ
jgi:elongation factor 1 alpha-like protein